MARIAADVERLQAQEDGLSLQIEAFDRDIELHTVRIDALYDEKRSNAKEGKPVYRHNVENEYSQSHPEYVALVEKRSEKSSELSMVLCEKSDRQSFHSRLEQCMKEIEDNEAEQF